MPIIILFFALSAFAQGSAPDWLKESWRTSHFPNSEWYIGFATDKASQPSSKEYEAIEANAKNKISESIVVNIQGSSTVRISNSQTQSGKNFSETTNTNYDNVIRTTSNSFLANVDVKSYFDKKAGLIYGFAAVKKADLADFYKSKISSLLFFAEKEFFIAEQIIETGKKNAALAKIHVIEDSLKNVAFWVSLLQVVEGNNFHAEQEKSLWQRTTNAKMQLQNGITVHLNISGNKEYSDLAEKLGAQMQEKGCNCTIAQSEENADYSVAIQTKLNRCDNNSRGEVYCYANANVVVNIPKYQKPVNVNIPEAKGGWTNENKDKATEEAFKELINYLADKIIQTINQ